MQLDAGMGQRHFCTAGALARTGCRRSRGWPGRARPAVDLVEEVAKSTARCWADSLPIPRRCGVQRGEQVDGAVPDVVVAAPLGHPGHMAAPGRFAAAPGSAASHRPRRPPRSPAGPGKADDVADLVDEQRVRGDLKSSLR